MRPRDETIGRIGALLAALVTAGCAQIPRRPSPPPYPSSGAADLSLHETAVRLGLDLAEVGETYAALEGEEGTVLLFCDPDARAFVNGRRVLAAGGIVRRGGALRVAEPVVAAIRETLRPRAARAHAPAPTAARRFMGGRRIVLDAGHGGRDPGATSVLGYTEKGVDLAVALEAARLLEEDGSRVTRTRSGDVFVELEARASLARRERAEVFVSVHSDSSPNRAARGFTLYVRRSAEQESRALARSLGAALAATGLPSRGIREAGYRVLERTDCPAVLVELGFLTNRRDAALLGDAGFRRDLAARIAAGIRGFLRSHGAQP